MLVIFSSCETIFSDVLFKYLAGQAVSDTITFIATLCTQKVPLDRSVSKISAGRGFCR